jgi:hypothetical protein
MLLTRTIGAMIGFLAVPVLFSSPICATRLDPRVMTQLVGGACFTKAQNYCQTFQACGGGSCGTQGNDGDPCEGGGGGSGSANICIGGKQSEECQLSGATKECTPTAICKCSSGICTQYTNTEKKSGNQTGATIQCKS